MAWTHANPSLLCGFWRQDGKAWSFVDGEDGAVGYVLRKDVIIQLTRLVEGSQRFITN